MSDKLQDVNVQEIVIVALGSASVGVIHFLFLLRRGRRFKILDLILEPSLAVFGGMLVWALNEAAKTPDILQAVMTSLAAWGGPRTIHILEQKYLGGSRASDSDPRPQTSRKIDE